MPANELLRPTFIVLDIDAAIAFYTSVFGRSVIFDQVIKVDERYPPADPKLHHVSGHDPEFAGFPLDARF